MISPEWTPNAELMLTPSKRERVLGMLWWATGVAMGLCPMYAYAHCCLDLLLSSPPQHPGKCTRSQATELAPSAAQSKLGVCHAGGDRCETR